MKRERKNAQNFIEDENDISNISTFAFRADAMINPQWLKLPISGTNFHGPKMFEPLKFDRNDKYKISFLDEDNLCNLSTQSEIYDHGRM